MRFTGSEFVLVSNRKIDSSSCLSSYIDWWVLEAHGTVVLFSNVGQRGCGFIRNTGGSLFIVMQVQKCGDLSCLGGKMGVSCMDQ